MERFADVETTLEANPTSIEAENFRAYRTAGINRVSVGVQALNDADLKALGRQHSAEEALAAFRLAAKVFPRVSFDMIYARPEQTPQQWREELSRAFTEQQGHMSLYQLTIEPGTAYFDLHERGSLVTPTDDRAADLYDLTQELTEQAGLPAYEVSNHAAPGQESRHNLLYWRYGEYAGVGPAHTAGWRKAKTAWRSSPRSTRKLARTRPFTRPRHRLGNRRAASGPGSEYLLMGLRIGEGIDLDRYATLAGREIDSLETRRHEVHGIDQARGAAPDDDIRRPQAAECRDCGTGQLALPCPSSRRKPDPLKRLNGSRLSPG